MDQEEYDALAFYTLAHPSPTFIHQHIVDAFAAQAADQDTKPIKLAFALIGLYLYLEKGYTGREVQKAHMQLGKHRRQWPAFPLPKNRGAVTPARVMKAESGEKRDAMIRQWCASVWKAYSKSHGSIAELVKAENLHF